MKKRLAQLAQNSMIRYIFFGGCTTLVNLLSFSLLCVTGMAENPSNIVSILIAILFAYVVNANFVFDSHPENLREHVSVFGKFLGARGVGMAVEVGGFWVLVTLLGLPAMIGKTAVQFLVIVLNYLLSRFFVFK